jgi:hypothetical protein
MVCGACAGGRLLCVAEGAGAQQALPRARGGLAVLHRAAQVPHAGAVGGALPARAHLHQQARREAVPRAPSATRTHRRLLSLNAPECAFGSLILGPAAPCYAELTVSCLRLALSRIVS